MNLEAVEAVARAVLYEGYNLYPYRPAAVKNRQRWTFGGIYPRAYSDAQGGTDPWTIQTECLLEGQTSTRLEVRLRFLQLIARRVGELPVPLPTLPAGAESDLRLVPRLCVGQRLIEPWQEATEREVIAANLVLGHLLARPYRLPLVWSARREVEPVSGPDGRVVGGIIREQAMIEGAVEIATRAVASDLFQVTVSVQNTTLSRGDESRDAALLHSLVSAHLILGSRDGRFVSLTDPPEPWRALASACHNQGVWPVLVGQPGERETVLAAPIILADYPQVAAESTGDLFDATEINEILTLRILTLTEEEKREMRSTDERTRRLLERTEALSAEQLWELHGTIRHLRPFQGGIE